MRRLLLLLLPVLSLSLAAQTPYLVKDINTTYSNDTKSSSPSEFAAFGTRTFFVATTDAAGTELWSTDGTSAGTSMVADIIPGTGSSSPSLLQAVNGVFLFNARDVNHGIELWTTDGTAAGTHLLTDINPGPTSSQPSPRIVYKNRMLFSADDGTNGRELWSSDGTAAGTRMVKDLNPGTASSNPGPFVLFGDNVYFFAVGGLWKTDGTDAGTVKVSSTSGRNLAPSGSQLFFEGFTSATNWEVWVSDGSDAGTHMVTEILPGTKGALDSNYSALGVTPFKNGVLFPANDGVHGRELWFSDGTAAGTRLVREFIPGAVGTWDSGYAYITAFGNRAYFLATDAEHGTEVWSTDGTEAGTSLFADLVPGPQSSYFLGFTVAGGRLFFAGGGISPDGPLLWVTDGTVSGTKAFSTSFAVSSSFSATRALWPVNGNVYFAGSTLLTATEPWTSDGTDAGTHLVANLGPDSAPSSNPFMLTQAGNLLFFNATEGMFSPTSHIAEASLWRTDGTAAGTFKLRETGQHPGQLSPAGPLVFFPEQGDNRFIEMVSDGTVAGTKPADDFMRRFGQWTFSALFPFGDNLFAVVPDLSVLDSSLWKFSAAPDGTASQLGARNPFGMIEWAGRYAFYAQAPGNSTYRYSLWTTDGTRAGTYAIVPDFGDTCCDKPSPLANAAGTLFFIKAIRGENAKLWKSDGTADGTIVVKELPASSSFRTEIKAAGRRVFFIPEVGSSSGSLWTSDGTEAGTVEVTKFSFFSSIQNDHLRSVGERVVYVSWDGVGDYNLRSSDGTKDGTKLLKSLGNAGSFTSLTNIDGLVYFNAADDANGVEAWTTDGTVEGTKLLLDMNPGPASSYASQFTKVGNLIYFTAYTEATGGELWALPVTTPSLSIAATHGTEGDVMHFNVSLAPAATQTVTVGYSTSDGTAKAGDDYDAASGTITFAPGETVKTIDVRMRGDVTPENNETFFVTLRNPSGGARIVNAEGVGIIDDDDQIADVSVALTASPNNFPFFNSVTVSNVGPRTATDVGVTFTATPSIGRGFSGCITCSVPQLAMGASSVVSSDFRFPQQQIFMSATAAPRQADPQPSNNTVTWTFSADQKTVMTPSILNPGAAATVTAALHSQTAPVTISDPSVLTAPSTVTKLASGLGTFTITALKAGSATITVDGQSPLLVSVVAAGTQPRWPGALTVNTDFSVVPIDSPMLITITPSGSAAVTGAKATGTVIVTVAGTEVARTSISGPNAITLPVYFSALGSIPYVVNYSGDANFLPQTDNGTAFVNRGRVTMTGGLERVPGAPGTFTLTVRATGSPIVAPTGMLSVMNGATEIAKVPLVPSGGISTAHATLTNLPASPTLTINYAGDTLYQSGSQQVRLVETRQRSARH